MQEGPSLFWEMPKKLSSLEDGAATDLCFFIGTVMNADVRLTLSFSSTFLWIIMPLVL